MNDKAEYVKKQTQTRKHRCHWPSCSIQVPPAKWGCPAHWFKLPKDIRDAIWAAYVPGQEERMDPSRAYREAAERAQSWIRSQR